MSVKIHPQSYIEKGAELGENVTIGPFCTVGSEVILGDNIELISHVVLDGDTKIGDDTKIWPFASIGTIPQDLKFGGEKTKLRIGKRNRIREYVTMNPGTKGGGGLTSVGNDCLFMMSSHIAHDVHVGNNVILANNATLAGHVTVGDHAIIGGLAAVRQFIRIGHHAMIGGLTAVENDVIPHGLAIGDRAKLAGLNLIGLQRSGMEKSDILHIQKAFKQLFAIEGSLNNRLETVKDGYKDNEVIMDILGFIEERGKSGICTVRQR